MLATLFRGRGVRCCQCPGMPTDLADQAACCVVINTRRDAVFAARRRLNLCRRGVLISTASKIGVKEHAVCCLYLHSYSTASPESSASAAGRTKPRAPSLTPSPDVTPYHNIHFTPPINNTLITTTFIPFNSFFIVHFIFHSFHYFQISRASE